MPRSSWKRPYAENSMLDKFSRQNLVLKSFEIMPNFVNKEYTVYNGKFFAKVKVLEEMVGHKFGEFCFTKKRLVLLKNNGSKS